MTKKASDKKTLSAAVIVSVLVLALGVSVRFIGNPNSIFRSASKADAPHTKITITPTKISSNDGYQVAITVDGKPYSGLLDYDGTFCKLKVDSTSCFTKQDAWGNYAAVNGIVTIPPNLNLPERYYLIRLKPRGYDSTYYSNFELQFVMNKTVMPAISGNSNRTLPMPPRGSYSILQNTDVNGNFAGYTRIDVETDTDPTLCGGDVWRYTKTTPFGYWNENSPTDTSGVGSDLRWCVIELPGGKGRIVKAISGEVYRFNFAAELPNIKVTYPNSFNGQTNQAFLGGYSKTQTFSNGQAPVTRWGYKGVGVPNWEVTDPGYMPEEYMLYPYNRKIPDYLPSTNGLATGTTLIDTAVGHPMEGKDTSMDIWHVEMMQPKSYAPADSFITFRQVENGFANRFNTKRWILTEDWTFNSQGLFTMIQQWWDTPARCWDPIYQCESGANRITAKVIETYIPDSRPLTLTLVGNGQSGATVSIPNGGSYELRVRQANGSAYSGFLEIGNGQTPKGIWRDAAKRPIYVSNGSVVVTSAAYGNAQNFRNVYTVRPYLTNSSINSLYPTADWGSTGLIPNASTAQFSNTVTQIVGTPKQFGIVLAQMSMDPARTYIPEDIPSYTPPTPPSKTLSKYKSRILGTFFVVAALATFVTYQSLNQSTRQTVKVSAAEVDVALPDVQKATGTTILYSNPSLLSIKQLDQTTGIYTLQYVQSSTIFPCSPGADNCEPDRFEIRYPGTSDKIFGLGVTPFKTNKAELDDFLDTSFGFGHDVTGRVSNGTITNLETWSGDIVRGRMPILTIPQKSLIIFYPQPDVKMMRLTRNINTDPKYTSGCPIGSTCMIFKKHNIFPDGATAPLVMIKGVNMDDAFAKYFSYIQNHDGIYKKPQYATFGNNWETFQELGCQPTSATVFDNADSIVKKFQQKNIQLSTVTMGSGWWTGIKTGASVGCQLGGSELMLTPATDAFGQNTERFPKGLDDIYTKLRSAGIVPIIGMRPQIQPGDLNNSNLAIVASKFGMPVEKIILPASGSSDLAVYYSGTTFTNSATGKLVQKYHFQLNVADKTVTDKWAELLTSSYGSFGGFKYDDMRNSDNIGFVKYLIARPTAAGTPLPTPPFLAAKMQRNDKDNIFVTPFKTFYEKYGQKFLIFTANNWFSQTDAYYNMCADSNYGTYFPDPQNVTVYLFKYCTDQAINTVLSGIPLQTNWGIIPPYTKDASGNDVPGNLYSEYDKLKFVRQHQLAIWYPVTMFSPGYWRLHTGTAAADTGFDVQLQNIVIWNMSLRQRLQRYVFDYASLGFDNKTTYLMRPLMFDYPNDPKVYDQYTELIESSTNRPAKDEYLFGKALLIRPVFSDDLTSLKIYFPAGKWLPLISNPATKGVVYSQGDVSYPYVSLRSATGNLDYPVFLKKGEILTIGDPNLTLPTMWAYVFLDPGETSNTYISYDKNGAQKFQMTATANAAGNAVTLTAKRIGAGDTITLTGTKEPSGKGFYVVNVSSVIN